MFRNCAQWAAKCKIREILHLFISFDLGDQEEFIKQKQVNIIQLWILCPYREQMVDNDEHKEAQ